MLIGRDATAALRLEGAGVSRRHAELYRQGPLYVLKDLGSKNGTWLDGKSVEHGPVQAGQIIRVGENVGVFATESPEDRPFGEVAPGVFGGGEMAVAAEPLQRGARAGLNVLLIGRTGTGKERVARAVHHFSGRSGPFFAINCAAVPEQLAEAELFGYRRGAFTGADRAGAGHFRAAHGGTLFLDEVAELSLSLQAKLLRVLEERKVLGLGETSWSSVDIQIVAALQTPVENLVEQGRFREDLAARLGGICVTLPPLAERRADIAPLFRRFLDRECRGTPPRIEPCVVEALCLHSWPQNVRELETMTRGLAALHGHEEALRVEHLPDRISSRLHQPTEPATKLATSSERGEHDIEKIEIELERHGGNVTAAAAALRIPRQRVYRLLNTRQQRARPADKLPE